VTRVVSGAVLIVLAVAVVWLAPAVLFQAFALTLLVLGVVELITLARTVGLDVPYAPAIAGAVLTLAACVLALSARPVDPAILQIVLLAQTVAAGAMAMARWDGGPRALATVAATMLPSLYLALPIAALVTLREAEGPAALFLLMLTIIASDTAQYYTGRMFGRRPLAPAISPKKTVEGAVGGFVFGAIVLAIVGIWWLPRLPLAFRALLGLGIVAMGIAGDLFESMLKRSAGVKDSSSLIPGHGGILDRIDALLFAAPVYFTVLRYL
jgi:phosphatidate cytidylyltransferase